MVRYILFLLTFCDVAQNFSVGGWKISSRVSNYIIKNYTRILTVSFRNNIAGVSILELMVAHELTQV